MEYVMRRWWWTGCLAVSLTACVPDDPPVPAQPANVSADGGAHDDSAPTAASLLDTVERMKEKLKGKQRDYDINIALGNLYYENGKFVDAIEYFSDGLTQVESVEKALLAAKPPAKGAVPVSCKLSRPAPDDVQACLEHDGRVSRGLQLS